MTEPRTTPWSADQKRRRLPVHEFVQHATVQNYSYCMYPDPDNAVSGICGMGRTWHQRVKEEAEAEAIVTAEEARAMDAIVGETREAREFEAIASRPRDQAIFKPVTYAQAKAAARLVVGAIRADHVDMNNISESAAYDVLKRWSEQDF